MNFCEKTLHVGSSSFHKTISTHNTLSCIAGKASQPTLTSAAIPILTATHTMSGFIKIELPAIAAICGNNSLTKQCCLMDRPACPGSITTLTPYLGDQPPVVCLELVIGSGQ